MTNAKHGMQIRASLPRLLQIQRTVWKSLHLLASRRRGNDVLRIPGLEVVIRLDHLRGAIGKTVHPRPFSVRSQPGLPLTN